MQDSVRLSPDGGIIYTCPAMAKCATTRASSIVVTVRDAGGCSRSGPIALTGMMQPARIETAVRLSISTPDGKCPNRTAMVSARCVFCVRCLVFRVSRE